MRRTELKRTAFARKAPAKRKVYRKKAATPEIRAYWDKVAALGCCVTGSHVDVTIHHVHGGSMRGILGRGKGMKADWFVLPLAATYHTGQFGIDGGMGVDTWESLYGKQLDYLLDVMRRTGINPFEKSGMPWPETVDKPDGM